MLLFVLCLFALLSKGVNLSAKGKCEQRIYNLTALDGSIQNIGYPYRYKRNQLCIYRILMPKGYRIKISFKKINIGTTQNFSACLKKDHLLLSTRQVHFEDLRSVSKKYQILLCGKNKPRKPILTQGRSLWIRFHSDPSKKYYGTGFKITYSAIDKNECAQKVQPCDHICINNRGSYVCKCHSGFRMKKDKKTCEAIFKVRFQEHEYNITVPSHLLIPGESVLTLSANVESSVNAKTNMQVTFTIRNQSIRNYFTLDQQTGLLSLSTKPRQDHKMFQIIVEAHAPNAKPDQSIITVVRERNELLEQEFTILLHHGDKVNDQIFNLKPYFNIKHARTTFSVVDNKYIGVDYHSGKVFVKSKLPDNKNSTVLWKTQLEVTIKLLDELGFESVGVSVLNVIHIPTFPGESFVTSEILKEVSHLMGNDAWFAPQFGNNVTDIKLNVAGLHRFLRQPSFEAQKVSRAKLYFDEVMKRVQSKVEQAYTIEPEKNQPVIIHLATKQIFSSITLKKIVDASKCKEILKEQDCSSFMFGSNYQPFDGACNNINHPLRGAATIAFKRLVNPLYYDADRLSDPIGYPKLPEAPIMPTAHHVSRAFFRVQKKVKVQEQKDVKNAFSHMLMQWGQFLDHDITMTAESEGGRHCLFPRCDNNAKDFSHPCFPMMYPNDEGCTVFVRSAAVCQTNDVQIEPRQQMNTITSYIDASMIYGSSKKAAKNLRTDDDTGQLKVSQNNYLPFVQGTLRPPLNACKYFGGCFEAGDARVNEQVVLTSMHTLWAREHNRIAKKLKHFNKHWKSERIYLETRKIVAAKIQHITYTEYLPKVLGDKAIPKYKGYDENVDPTISNVFATAAFRFGHSLVQPAFSMLDANFDQVAPDLPLRRAFFNNTLLLQTGIEHFLFGMVGNQSSTVDRDIAHGLSRGLFQIPGASHGFDLAALNIQRGRDHGLPGYGRWREFCNLPKAYTFEELADTITNNVTRSILRTLYNDQVEYTDLFAAGLAEDHVDGAIVGPSFHCIIKDQFIRLRDGDRYFYENEFVFTKIQLEEIKKVTLASVMCNNMKGIVSIQPDVFKAFGVGTGKRRICNSIPQMDLNAWAEFKENDKEEWTNWHETTNLSTGSWNLQPQLCHNKSIIDIECRSMDNTMYSKMNENAKCMIPIGVYCRNDVLAGTKCSDYKMRMLCSTRDIDVASKVRRTGYPIEIQHPSLYCKKGRISDDYAIAFPAADEAVLESLYHTTPKQEYLYVGKTKYDKKRIIIRFDLRRIKKTDAVHSATLQLFYVGHGRTTFHSNVKIASYLEAYLITSTHWNSTTVTSRVPWRKDYLNVGTDTDEKQLDNVEIESGKPYWLHLDLYRAMRQWRLSSTQTRPNFGIMLMLRSDDEEIGMVRIASSLHDNISIRPRLLVCLAPSTW